MASPSVYGHDAQVNFTGTQLATSSCDKTIRVFDVNVKDGSQFFVEELKGHQGPVWQVAWGHPSFGTYLASCSYDRKVIIWKETRETKPDGKLIVKWDTSFVYEGHDSSVNSVCWAPPSWSQCRVLAPADAPNFDKTDGTKQIKRFASGGCDNLVKIWREENDQWVEETKLVGHTDWVRDVAWSPGAGLSKRKIASCSQDRKVIIWVNKQGDGMSYTPEPLHVFPDVIWHISWNLVGDVLAVSGGDNQVSFVKLFSTLSVSNCDEC
ncbi:Protein SEC13 [Orchesella cincta]|uniref:Protein SEC13 homolog n=1 Tax=Orchesella cincta TaxID=48709 RepID=A0A1D2M9H4_ORCCI|nr:Protein SEC13 [Orchesella cincta]